MKTSGKKRPQEQTEQETADPEDDSEEESPVSEEYVDFEADDGSVIKLPAAAKDAVLRRADYTKKTEQLATRERLAQDKIHFAEAREQLSAAVLDDLTEYRSLEKELAQYQGVDWSLLYESNPGQAFALQQRRTDLEKRVSAKERDITSKAKGLQEAQARHVETQWTEAEKGARQIIGNVTAAENVAMAQTVEALGFTTQEFKSKFADPRIIAAVHKAAKWDSLQANKSNPKAANAPPIVKSGAVNTMSAQSKQELSFRKAMRSAPNSNTKARLIEQRLADRFK